MSPKPGNRWPRLARDTQAAKVDGEEMRYVLRRPDRAASCVRLGDTPAALVFRLDGSREIDDVVQDAGRTFGKDAPALLVRLLAELGDRGFLQGVAAPDVDEYPAVGPIARLFRPRTWRWRRAPEAVDRIYRNGGWLLVTPEAWCAFCAIALAGLAALVLLLARGSLTPLVVSGKLGLGAACFLGGRALLVAVHELAHALALERTGHRVAGAGIKLIAIFPYAFVDTSPVWLEPRRKRMAVTAAGPLTDLVLGGSAAIGALLTRGVASEICYQLCLAGYLAALLNLNPCLERDGYHLLCDVIRRPGLRTAAIADLQSRLAGRGPRDRARPLRWYGLAVVVWGVAGAGLAVASLSHAFPAIRAALPHDVSVALLGSLWLVLLAPTGVLIGRPLAMHPAFPGRVSARPRPTVTRPRRRDMPAPQVRENPITVLARQVLSDASLRQRVRMLGQPPGFEVLGDRELKSSVAGVVLAAGGESLALAHTAGVLEPQIQHLASSAISDTNLTELRSLLGLEHPAQFVTPHLESNLLAVPHVQSTTPILYEPPAPRGHIHELTGNPLTLQTPASDSLGDQWLSAGGGTLPPWPGNDAGEVAIAHWMAEGAEAAGLPGPLPVMAALVESGLNNNACCDHDSLGYFQMRESIWNMGPYTGYYENPDLQLQWFMHEALEVRNEIRAGGDPGFGNDPSSWGKWIADVENPAVEYRYRYQLQLATAEALLNQPAPLPGASTVFEPTASTTAGPDGPGPGLGAGTQTTPDSDDGELVNTPSGQSFRDFLQGLYEQPSDNPSQVTYVPPFNTFDATWERTDQGVDIALQPGDPVFAIGRSRVAGITPGWFDGEPFVWLQLLDGPYAGHYYYVAEQITPSVTVGEVLNAGQPMATYAGSGTGIEIGWATPGGDTLARAIATGALPSSALDGLPGAPGGAGGAGSSGTGTSGVGSGTTGAGTTETGSTTTGSTTTGSTTTGSTTTGTPDTSGTDTGGTAGTTDAGTGATVPGETGSTGAAGTSTPTEPTTSSAQPAGEPGFSVKASGSGTGTGAGSGTGTGGGEPGFSTTRVTPAGSLPSGVPADTSTTPTG